MLSVIGGLLARRSAPALMRGLASATGTRVDHARACIKAADAVCFDVDSTVITTEGIDDLAAFLGCGDKVAALTAQAMGGSMPFHEALALRLSALQPTPGVKDLIEALHANKQDVYFVSGGFRQMI